MVQAAVLDGLFLDLFSPFDDGGVTPEVSVGGCDVTNALMVTLVIVMIDEGADLVFEIAGQIVVLQQDAVLQGLMPTLDLALGLRVIPSRLEHYITNSFWQRLTHSEPSKFKVGAYPEEKMPAHTNGIRLGNDEPKYRKTGEW